MKRSALSMVLLAGVLGCGPVTTAPAPSAARPAETAPPQAVAPGPTTNGLIGPIGSLFTNLRGLTVRTTSIAGNTTSTLANGRWQVAVPTLAIQGTASIAIGVASTSSGECDLEILPASKNKFEVPVTLTVDCSSVGTRQLANYVLWWFDPATRRWVVVEGSQVDLVHKTVSAPLSHFSRYSVGPADGKAGW
jgi:hypothetical protein